MSDELITAEEARKYAGYLLNYVNDAAEGTPLPDDAVSIAWDLDQWVNAVADVGGLDVE